MTDKGNELGQQPSSLPASPNWTDRQVEIRDLLIRIQARPLANAFEALVRLRCDPMFPARGRLVAHCLREIVNNVGSYLRTVATERVEYPQALDKIMPLWEQAGLPIGKEGNPLPLTDRAGGPFGAIVPDEIVEQLTIGSSPRSRDEEDRLTDLRAAGQLGHVDHLGRDGDDLRRIGSLEMNWCVQRIVDFEIS